MKSLLMGAALGAMLLASQAGLALADETNKNNAKSTDNIEEVVVTKGRAYATSVTSKDMMKRQAQLGSVNQAVSELPGVHITEGDHFGSSDWVTTITMRGFKSGAGGQQIGTTIEGLPNGSSNYGGGSRANRFIDILDLKAVEVSQGTADISSRSNEALGGTLKFHIDDPAAEKRVRVFALTGDQSASKYYVRVDTGEFLPNTFAFVSGSRAKNNDWIDNVTPTTRDYLTGKLQTTLFDTKLTAVATWNKANESEFDPILLSEFSANPRRDRLTSNWVGIPQIDQQYRDVWRAHRENIFAYVRAEKTLGEVKLNATVYNHNMWGQGDWAPPYIVDVTDNAGGAETELKPGVQVLGGKKLGEIYFVNPNGSQATLIKDCVGSNGLPAKADPKCYLGNVAPVMSYRHSHYKTRRVGLTADAEWSHDFGLLQNTLRGGIWLEDGESRLTRDWHRVLDARVGPGYDKRAYWVQFRDNHVYDEFMYYVEDVAQIGPVTARLGVKQFFVDRERYQDIGTLSRTELSSDSDPLFNLGISYETPIEGLEAFAGYSENFNAISQDRMGATTAELTLIKPETAENKEIGFRFSRDGLRLAATYYDITFENRIVFIRSGSVAGIDYLSQIEGKYFNIGGLKSTGLELLGSYNFGNGWRVAGSYTSNSSEYTSTGSNKLDESAGVKSGSQVFGSPKTMFNMSADYSDSNWGFGIGTKYVGEQYINFANSLKADSYYLTNAYVSVNGTAISETLKGVEARLTINNLTDTVFINGINGSTVYPGAPRTVTFSVMADF